ncbi:DUF434 domain-containing protein [Ochrobactrum sp. MR28]|nr:DUF434 domain-containing protein [Ochrobactrum sp. MR28]MBX8817112.1 DUF434 domain-containing protein [Ochrobactrum sp. MR31]
MSALNNRYQLQLQQQKCFKRCLCADLALAARKLIS